LNKTKEFSTYPRELFNMKGNTMNVCNISNTATIKPPSINTRWIVLKFGYRLIKLYLDGFNWNYSMILTKLSNNKYDCNRTVKQHLWFIIYKYQEHDWTKPNILLKESCCNNKKCLIIKYTLTFSNIPYSYYCGAC
jgi:hypothetical protein